MSLSQSIVLDFNISGVAAYTKLTPYIFGVDYSGLVIPEYTIVRAVSRSDTSSQRAGLPGDLLITNSSGSVNGKIILPRSVVAGYSEGDLPIKFYSTETTSRGRGGASLTETKEYSRVSATIIVKYSSVEDAQTTTSLTTTRDDNIISDTLGTAAIPSIGTRGTIGGSISLIPLAQTFYVDATRYTQGLFISSIDLFFAQKDSAAPVSIELRKVVNGLPDSSQYISGTVSSVESSAVNIPTDVINGPILPTKFSMTHPIHLSPGEYAVCIHSNSDQYSLYYAKLGEYVLGTNKILDKESYSGKLFKSQNTNLWLEENNTDICFRVNKAVFETGTKQFEIQTLACPNEFYHNFYLDCRQYNFGDLTSITYDFNGRYDNAGNFVGYSRIKEQTPVRTSVPLIVHNAGDIKFQVSFTNTSKDITPIFDMQSAILYTFKNNIDPYDADTSNSETNSNDGVARSKYISKPVTLQPGFDSTGLEVKVAVNRQIGTDIEVFCRVLSSYDNGTNSKIENRSWRKMPLFNQNANVDSSYSITSAKSYAGASENSYTVETYKILEGDSVTTTGVDNLSYTGTVSNGTDRTDTSATVFNNFNKFQIKIVMYASSTDTYIPKIKNLIATAVL